MPAKVLHAHLWGTRDHKYRELPAISDGATVFSVELVGASSVSGTVHGVCLRAALTNADAMGYNRLKWCHFDLGPIPPELAFMEVEW